MTSTTPRSVTRYAVTMTNETGTWWLHLLQPLTSPSWSETQAKAKTWASAAGARRAVAGRLMTYDVVPVRRVVR